MKTFALLVILAGSLVLTACEDTTAPPPDFEDENLTQRSHVLNNIEYAYKTRRPDIYDELLNADFVFFLSPADVGGNIPASWSRADEQDATSRLFLSNQQPAPVDPVCRSMRLDLVFDKDDLQWAEVKPSAYPNETWYSTTVFYTFIFEIEPDMTYIAIQAAKAQFTVRNNPQNGKDHWELVELRDLGSSPRQSSTVGVEEATWGKIKALY